MSIQPTSFAPQPQQPHYPKGSSGPIIGEPQVPDEDISIVLSDESREKIKEGVENLIDILKDASKAIWEKGISKEDKEDKEDEVTEDGNIDIDDLVKDDSKLNGFIKALLEALKKQPPIIDENPNEPGINFPHIYNDI